MNFLFERNSMDQFINLIYRLALLSNWIIRKALISFNLSYHISCWMTFNL